MQVEDHAQPFQPVNDTRLRMYEPPVVRLISIDDVTLHATPATAPLLDFFYIQLLGFERHADDLNHTENNPKNPVTQIIYRAEKNSVIFDIVNVVLPRDDYRPVQVATPLFDLFVRQITELEMPFEWQKGVAPGLETVLLKDPAGNWMLVEPIRAIA
jgi:hypothetical protein